MSHRVIRAALEHAAAGDAHRAVDVWRTHASGTATRLVLAYALLRVMLDGRGASQPRCARRVNTTPPSRTAGTQPEQQPEEHGNG
jgi:hypothetical protein